MSSGRENGVAVKTRAQMLTSPFKAPLGVFIQLHACNCIRRRWFLAMIWPHYIENSME